MRLHPRVLTSSGLTTATTAYTSGDVLGAEMTMPVSKYEGTATGRIIGAMAIDDSNVVGALDLFFFNAASTPAADNAANAWSDANMKNLVWAVSLSTILTSGNNKVVTTGLSDVSVPFYAPTGSLYVVAVTRTGNAVFAGGASSLTYKVYLEV